MALRPPNSEHPMESDTRFDLTAALARWTGDFAKRGHLEPEKIAELESHLHDSIAGMQQRGLDEAEAFLIATRRLGSPAQIETEFEKAETALLPRRALWWLVLGVAGWTTFRNGLGTLEGLLALAGSSFATDQTGITAIICAAKLLSLGLLVGGLLAVFNQHAKLQDLVNFSVRRPWHSAGILLLANGLFWFTSLAAQMVLFRQTPVALAAEFARTMSIGSLISSSVSLGIVAFILTKVRPGQVTS